MWPARVSPEYSTGVQSIAARAGRISGWVNGQTPLADVPALNAELAALKADIHRIMKRGRHDLQTNAAERRAVAKAAAKYAKAERQAAAARDAEIMLARAA